MADGARHISPEQISTRQAIHRALVEFLPRYMPTGAYRKFYEWALSNDNPRQQQFVRSLAVDQLAVLTDSLLKDLCEPERWPELLQYAIPVTLHQTFEVVSDNLGLAQFGVTQQVSPQRKLATEFNRIVIEEFQSPTLTPARELLSPLTSLAGSVSGFQQSLTSALHTQIARHYAEVVGESISDVEHGIWHGLVANLETGRQVLKVVENTHAQWLVRQSTVDRYHGVNRTLSTRQLSRLERATVGAQTIMVVPTLSYFTTVFAEIVGKDPVYGRTVDDGTLLEVLADAALLVRLQNDIGTVLLDMPEAQCVRLICKLPDRFPLNDSGDTALRLLSRAAADEPVFNRFHKDLHNGEYNVCLAELYSAVDIDEGLAALTDSLLYFSSLYQQHKRIFMKNLASLDARLKDHRICELISRFVTFHQRMYTHQYDEEGGDYAI